MASFFCRGTADGRPGGGMRGRGRGEDGKCPREAEACKIAGNANVFRNCKSGRRGAVGDTAGDEEDGVAGMDIAAGGGKSERGEIWCGSAICWLAGGLPVFQ